MTIRPILVLPDPLLRRVSEPVVAVDDAVRTVLNDMLAAMYDAPGVGLAAIQIGVPKRLVVIDCNARDDPREPLRLVNPEILWVSDEINEHEEGCLSIPEFYEVVERPASCRVRYLDETGAECERHCEGLLATCVQHEIDHLNGVLFIDHVSRLKRDRIVRKFQKAAREREREDGMA